MAADVSPGGGEWSGGAGGSDVGPKRPGQGGGGGGGSCCLSSGCGPSELGEEPGPRARCCGGGSADGGSRVRGRAGAGAAGVGGGALERRGLREGGPLNPVPPLSPSPSPQPSTPSPPRSPGGGLCPVTMTTPANAQNASKTWELSLYELHRTPQVIGSSLHSLLPLPKTLNPQTLSHSLFSIFCPILPTLSDFTESFDSTFESP